MVVTLQCITANNAYVVGDEIPIESVWANDGNNDDGGPYRIIRINALNILVWLGAGIYSFFAANTAPITLKDAGVEWDRLGWDHADVLKIDTEGYELPTLEGLGHLFERQSPHVGGRSCPRSICAPGPHLG